MKKGYNKNAGALEQFGAKFIISQVDELSSLILEDFLEEMINEL